MNDNQVVKLFEMYNPIHGVVECPKNKEQTRDLLDAYAMAAVNLYGIIRSAEFVEIFNNQNNEQTTVEEVRALLLPNVRKAGLYWFYKDCILHPLLLEEFEWFDYLEKQQDDKPRYIPSRDEFLCYEDEGYEDNDCWGRFRAFIFQLFGHRSQVVDGCVEVVDYLKRSPDLHEFADIMESNQFYFNEDKQFDKLASLIEHARNKTRIWENKGYTPQEMMDFTEPETGRKLVVSVPHKIGKNQLCPCGSGKKHKSCCAIIEKNGRAHLAHDGRKLFYETWYKLLDFTNRKLNVVDYTFTMKYGDSHEQNRMLAIRNALWTRPELIYEFTSTSDTLAEEEILLLESWDKRRVMGDFIVMEYGMEHAVFMQPVKDGDAKLYAVKGISNSIANTFQKQLPYFVTTVLLPFGDIILYDTFVISRSTEFGKEFRDSLMKEYNEAKKKHGIIKQL